MSEEVTFRAKLTSAQITYPDEHAFIELRVVPYQERVITIQLQEEPRPDEPRVSPAMARLLEALTSPSGAMKYVDVTLRPAQDE